MFDRTVSDTNAIVYEVCVINNKELKITGRKETKLKSVTEATGVASVSTRPKGETTRLVRIQGKQRGSYG